MLGTQDPENLIIMTPDDMDIVEKLLLFSNNLLSKLVSFLHQFYKRIKLYRKWFEWQFLNCLKDESSGGAIPDTLEMS